MPPNAALQDGGATFPLVATTDAFAFQSWALDSRRIAIDTAYKNLGLTNVVDSGKGASVVVTLPNAYPELVQKASHRQLLLAGYRLGHLLNFIFARSPFQATSPVPVNPPDPPLNRILYLFLYLSISFATMIVAAIGGLYVWSRNSREVATVFGITTSKISNYNISNSSLATKYSIGKNVPDAPLSSFLIDDEDACLPGGPPERKRSVDFLENEQGDDL